MAEDNKMIKFIITRQDDPDGKPYDEESKFHIVKI